MLKITDYHQRSHDVLTTCDLCVLDDLRLFYIHHATRSSHWEPPWAAWNCRLGLPYAWEQAVDADGHVYYIDHIHRRTTYLDPRRPEALAEARKVTVRRDPVKGFGFVAAGQHPTVIQFVSPGGPSDGKLYAQDEILEVEGVDVSNEPKDEVVNRVRAASDSITLTVQQCKPSPRRQCRVRFTDSVQISSPDTTGLPPPLPNVLRVFLENGQTRSFRYDEATTVKDVCESLGEKLCLGSLDHFCLCVEYNLGARSSRITMLRPETTLESIALLPNASHLRCVFRFAFVPADSAALLQRDPKAFEYYYSQCVSDMVQGRFAYEMRYEACIRLAALHIQQLCQSTGCCFREGKISLRKVEKEFGLVTFLPTVLLENVKRKEVRRHLRYYLRRDDPNADKNSAPISQEERSQLSRLKYVQIVSHLPSFVGRSFSVTLKDSHTDMIVQVDPVGGLLMRHPGSTRAGQPTISVGFDLLAAVSIRTETPVLTNVSIKLHNNSNQGLEFLVDKDEVSDLAVFICGYYRLAKGQELPLDSKEAPPPVELDGSFEPPPYDAVHAVVPAGWNYSVHASPGEKLIDFSEEPPPYHVANTFNEVQETRDKTFQISKPELPLIEEESNRAALQSKLLKATDSFLIKSSKELHIKETTSPLLKRRSNPSGRKVDPFSDSSDTEGSSRASPTRLPRDVSTLSGLSTLSELSSPEHHASVETLVHAGQNGFKGDVHNNFNVIDLTSITPCEEQKGIDDVAAHTRRTLNGAHPQSARSDRRPKGSDVYMSRMNLDRAGVEDFLRRSNSICENSDAMEEVPVRRMSLKEYTGVESEHIAIGREAEHPSWKESVSSASLLSSCSKRRRSLLSNEQNASGSTQKLSVQVEEPLSIEIVRHRIESLRSKLNDTQKDPVGVKGPKLTEVKKKLCEEMQLLEGLVGEYNTAGDGQAVIATEMYEVIKHVVDVIDEMAGQCDVFHRKLVNEEIDQVLKALGALFAETPSADATPTHLLGAIIQLRHTLEGL
ncbi:unnamed protein product, partial [Mesorhabditis spiculigera]